MNESNDENILITVNSEYFAFTNLLQQWEMINLLPLLNENKIDFDALSTITEQELDLLFPDVKQMGTKIKFRRKVVEWRKANSVKVEATSHNSARTHRNVKIHDWMDNCINRSIVLPTSSTSSWSGNIDETSFYKNEIDDMFLLPDMVDILRNLQNKPQNTSRVLLCNTIVAYLLNRKLYNLSSTDFLYIIDHILKHCPQEQAEHYFQNGPLKKGKLYYKYRNGKQNLRRFGHFENLKKVKLSIENCENVEDEVIEEFSVKVSKNWLIYHSEPWEMVVIHWKVTAPERLSYFRKSIDNNIIEFLNEWPIIKSLKGYRLIDMDFEFLYPEKTLNLSKKFTKNFSKKLFLEIVNDIKDKTIQEAGIKMRETILGDEFKKYDFCLYHKNYIIAELFKQLNGFLVTTSRIKSIDNSKIWKPSIVESFESFLYYVADVSEIKEILVSKKQKYAEFGLILQPSIFLLHHINENRIANCFVCYDDIFYIFEDLMQAIDINFKIYFVMHLNYPVESCKIYKFLEHVIYEMSASNDVPVKIRKLKELLLDG